MSKLDTRVNAVRSDLADVELEGRVEAQRFVAGAPCRVVAPRAAVRRAPSDDALLDTEALCGEGTRLFETNAEEWAWVQLEADRYVGWMRAEALAKNPPAPTHKVTALSTFAFAKPDIKSRVLAWLPLGARVAVTGEAEDKNARYGLIAPAGAVVMQHLAPLVSVEPDWVAVAERFLGTPYLWGGKTCVGIDCSGLVQVALQACGIVAPRDTDMQEAAIGEPLPFEGGLPPLRRGDLVFWKSHVGIMRDEETLLHANAHHMAVAEEPVRVTVERLAGKGLEITAVRRVAGR
jgi:cell wall-associated NlpC family hydrolase